MKTNCLLLDLTNNFLGSQLGGVHICIALNSKIASYSFRCSLIYALICLKWQSISYVQKSMAFLMKLRCCITYAFVCLNEEYFEICKRVWPHSMKPEYVMQLVY